MEDLVGMIMSVLLVVGGVVFVLGLLRLRRAYKPGGRTRIVRPYDWQEEEHG